MKTLVWTRAACHFREDKNILDKFSGKINYIPCVNYQELGFDQSLVEDFINKYTPKVVVTSKRAAQLLFAKKIKKIELLKFITVGSQTNFFLKEQGICATNPCGVSSGESLANWILEQVPFENSLLLPGAMVRAFNLEKYLSDFYSICRVDLYKATESLVEQGVFPDDSIVAFLSPAAVRSFCKSLLQRNYLRRTLLVVVIGDTTLKEAKKYFVNCYKSQEATIKSVIAKAEQISSHSSLWLKPR
jgi:uroporphyrinogen-III synthase